MAAAHLPRIPVFVFPLLVFLGVHVPPSHGSPAPAPLPLTSYDPSICLETKCGGIDIRYPFYRSSATRETPDYKSNYSCGYTDLEISCQGEWPIRTPVIQLGGDNYTVLDIIYENHTIILADSDVLGVAKCPAVRHNMSFDDMWLYNASSNDNLTFFFGCNHTSGGLGMYQINCVGFNSPFGSGPSFVFTPDVQAPEHDLVCNKTVSVPVIKSELLTLVASNLDTFTSGGYGDVLKKGFELVWNYTDRDQCYQQCEQSHGQCAYSSSREFLGCLCNDGKSLWKSN
ncbi:hypothetical protein U9M48_018055 [Paspalum notatum var. saurae]|uniref:Wall-associated receptor kinase galacturonan-binding domain-containing protein n=1 Tax=Paspalum notatum var. saurae TaxID=547442 RepID=A0AAQ3T8R9_PASNO